MSDHIEYENLHNAQDKVEPMTNRISTMKEKTDDEDTMNCNGTTMSKRSDDLTKIETDAKAINDWKEKTIKSYETWIQTGNPTK